MARAFIAVLVAATMLGASFGASFSAGFDGLSRASEPQHDPQHDPQHELPRQLPGLHNVVPYTGSGSEAFYSGSAPEGDAGFDALVKLGIKTVISVDGATPDLARAKAELERSQASREQAELRLRQRVAELCRALNSGSETLRVAKLSLAARQKKIEEEVRRHAEGLLSTHDLRIAQEELDGAELNELQARLSLLGNQASLGQLDGNLAGRHGISL